MKQAVLSVDFSTGKAAFFEDMLLDHIQYVFSFVSIRSAGYVIGEGNKPGDVY
ncbi:hypothetical protein BBR47_10380 [Brevibacillus brevis NBRC 100599]|uniref:Uncharacterized protein n=1 Tax=Brevibacillus brevis (strain 47 / JCM 6285 / NBRC 100599) TaxID=358681 RepID=C0Z658_BREBN|nr:hypothetical protein BBR47_10380 [Brevibacillus brevis NBRC 100599]